MTVLVTSSSGTLQPPAPTDPPADPFIKLRIRSTLPLQPDATRGISVIPVTQPAPPPVIPAPSLEPIPALPAAPTAPAGPAFPAFALERVPQIPVGQEPEIVEPVASVHRFTGKYIGGNDRRALVYVETGAGKAEIQSRPLAHSIPKADTESTDAVKRIEVPAGRVAYHDSRAFVTSRRELTVIGADGTVEWRFTLPGKTDNGETLFDVAGFHDGKVYVASQHTPRPDTKNAPSGHVYALELTTGRQVGFTTVTDGFAPDDKLVVAPSGVFFALGRSQIRTYELQTGRTGWGIVPGASDSIRHATTGVNEAVATTSHGIVLFHSGRQELILKASGTAPAAIHFDPHRGTRRMYAPLQFQGTFLLSAHDFQNSNSPWSVLAPREIRVAPVVRGQSVYFVAGNALYRVNATTGAICWKHTLALNPGDTLTDLTFNGGELHASGPGVLVRVTERAESPPLVTPPVPVGPDQ
jgi:outer membrane protein assembly factor BamB